MVYDRASTALFQRSFSSNVSLAFEKKEGKLINEITKEINVWFMGGVFNNSAYLDYDDKTVMNSNMFVLGADYLSNNLIMGFAFGYSSEELSEIDNSFFNYLGDSYFLSLYLGKMIDYGLMNFYGITSLSYMGSFADIERKAIGFADSYNSFDYIDNAVNFKLEVGSVFNLDKMFFSINPYLGLGVDYYNQDNYIEDGESYTMEVKGNNFVDSNIVIGNKIFYDFLIDTNVIVKPIIDIYVKRSFKDNGYTASKFSDDNSNYYMYNKDANFEKFSFNYSFGMSYIKKNIEVSLYYANKIYSVNSTELNDASFRFKFVYSL
jgi:outer membrane autotransporter protein